ncbi:TonB-dependent receptor [Croceicoccus ponticola]|nr:TonB-dependent receptor [Croceicoccus ponticola]
MRGKLFTASAMGLILPLACLAAPALAQSVPDEPGSEEVGEAPNAIIVTAQRRAQSLTEVPQAVQAIGGEALKELGVEQIQDVIALVPSATIGSTISVGSNTFQIRGVAASETDGDPTVGFYLDNFAFSMPGRPYAPATDFYDLNRIEVLRGPSGTLYGLGSLGGTIKLLTNDPDLDEVELSTRISANITDGGEPGGGGDVMFNVPVSTGKVALRGVVSYKMIGGFADNIATNKDDANDANAFTGRVKLRAEPTERLMVQLAAWHNRSNQDYSNRITIAEPPLLNQTFGIADSKFTLFTGDIEYDLGFATLMSTTGHIKNTVVVNNGGFIPGIGDFTNFWPLVTKNFNEDLRLASNPGGPLNWIVGVFYQNGETKGGQSVALPDFTVANQVGLATFNDNTIKSKAWAVYGEATYSILDGLADLTLGGRYFEEKRTFIENSSITLIEAGIEVPTVGTDRAKNNTFNPRFNVSIHPTDDGMIYAEVAKGFRSGSITSSSIISGANTALGTNFDNSSPPDTLWNYEAGLKWSFGLMDVSLSGYYFDWKDAQIELSPTLQSIVVPIGDVKGRGVDAELSWRTPLDGLTLQAAGNINKTELRDVIPQVAAALPWLASGSQLPGTAKKTFSATASYTADVGNGWDLKVNGRYSYRSKQQSVFNGAYAPWNGFGSARIGFGKDDFDIAIFSNNIGNSGRPISKPGGQNQVPYPRTIGITMEKSF